MNHMLNVLVVDDEAEVRDLLTLVIEGGLEHISVTQAKSAEEAVELLKSSHRFACIISDFEMGSSGGISIYNFLKSENVSTPLIFYSNFPEEHIIHSLDGHPAAVIPKSNGTRPLKEKVRDLCRDQFYQAPENELYCKFRPSQLLKIGILPSDTFIKLSENKYVRVFHRGDSFDSEDLERFTGKKLTYLYVSKDDFFEIIKKMEEDLHKINQLVSEFQEDMIEIPVSAHSLIREFYQKFGIDQKIQKVVRESIELTLKSIRTSPKLKDLFKKIKQNEKEYLSYHSILLAHISCMLATKMEWTSNTTTNKLTMAAFLHDICLDDLGIDDITHLEEELRNKSADIFHYPKLLKYSQHPQQAADLFDKIEEPIPDVSTILAQHHELPDGTGFPHKLNALTIFPLAAILIVAHGIVDEYFKSGKEIDLGTYINNLPPSYSKGNFRAVTRALTDLIIDF